MKLFIVNLERSLDRRALMQEKLEALAKEPLFRELGLEYSFFHAIDSKSKTFQTYKAKFSPHKCYLLHGRILIDNEIACYASHYSLWQECVKCNEPLVVLEDDIFFEPHFLSALHDIMQTKFLFVRFFTSARRRDKYIYQIGDSPYHYSLKNTNATLGYYLTPEAARAFVAQEVWDSPVDIQMEFVARHRIDNVIYKPFLVGEDSIASFSTIVNPDGSHRASKIDSIQSINGGGGGNTCIL